MLRKKILITGSQGYIGTNLYYYLKKKYNVFGIDKKNCDKKYQKKQFKINILNENKLKFFFNTHHFDFIIHLAAISGIRDFNKNPKKKISENTKMVKNILNCIINKNTKIIFFSSAAVYKKQNKNRICENYPTLPFNSYGLSKLKCEKLIMNNQKNNDFVIFRPFNVMGNLQKKYLRTISFIQILFRKLNQKNKTIKIFYKNKKGNKEVPTRDFVHLYDICRIVELGHPELNNILLKLIKQKKIISENFITDYQIIFFIPGLKNTLSYSNNYYTDSINDFSKYHYLLIYGHAKKLRAYSEILLKNNSAKILYEKGGLLFLGQ